MIVEPKVREFICTTAHPIGCMESVKGQIEVVQKKSVGHNLKRGPKKALIIGASTGYGLASRISAAFGFQCDTLGIMYERQASGKRTATAGWYNTAAFETLAQDNGLYAKTINGDAFSSEIKAQAVEAIKADLGQVDLVIYSLAAPRRVLADGTVASSTLKTKDEAFTEKSLNLKDNTICEKTIEPATKEEVEGTVKVMGGEDWKEWISLLKKEGVLSANAITVAYSYIGPELTYPIYYNGTIGMAKRHLHNTADELRVLGKDIGLQAYVSVNKALVTQASSAIPIVPLYFSILYKVMKKHGTHEGCIEQMSRLFFERLYEETVETDEEGLIRMDDWEMRQDTQQEIIEIWEKVNSDNVLELADLEGYWEDFYHMFGFQYENVDYAASVDVDVKIPSISEGGQ